MSVEQDLNPIHMTRMGWVPAMERRDEHKLPLPPKGPHKQRGGREQEDGNTGQIVFY